MCSHIGAATLSNLQTESRPYDGRTFWERQIHRMEGTTQSVREVGLQNFITLLYSLCILILTL